MTDLSAEFKVLAEYRPTHKVRFVTAASLFDGHDAAINIMRRILQGMGAEVIHLGHDRSVDEIVTAALQEDVQGVAISSYQGGHVEYFKYMVDLLKARGGERIQVFGGGGGVIVPAEIHELQGYGVSRIRHALHVRTATKRRSLALAAAHAGRAKPGSLKGLERGESAEEENAFQRSRIEPECSHARWTQIVHWLYIGASCVLREWRGAAVKTFCDHAELVLPDCLPDLMHYAQREGIDFTRCIDRARGHHEERKSQRKRVRCDLGPADG